MLKKLFFALAAGFGSFSAGLAQSFSVSDTAISWHTTTVDSLGYSLVELYNGQNSNVDIGFYWEESSPMPAGWFGEIEYPYSNGYTSSRSGSFRLFSGGQNLIFFSFHHNQQLGLGRVKVHLYDVDNPADSINLRFEMEARPYLSNPQVINGLASLKLAPNPTENGLIGLEISPEWENKIGFVRVYALSTGQFLQEYPLNGSFWENPALVCEGACVEKNAEKLRISLFLPTLSAGAYLIVVQDQQRKAMDGQILIHK